MEVIGRAGARSKIHRKGGGSEEGQSKAGKKLILLIPIGTALFNCDIRSVNTLVRLGGFTVRVEHLWLGCFYSLFLLVFREVLETMGSIRTLIPTQKLISRKNPRPTSTNPPSERESMNPPPAHKTEETNKKQMPNR